MIKKASALTAIFMMFSLAALAADVSGTWTGIFHTREGGAFETNLVLKASGDAFTGTLQQGNSDEIQIEDVKICETVQKNLHSRSYERGRYSVKQEKGVHAFHRMYVDAMKKTLSTRREH